MKKFALTILLLTLWTGIISHEVFSQTIEIDSSFIELDSYFEKVVKDWDVPGMAIGVVKDNKIIYLGGFGLRNIEEGLSVNENTLFHIGSIGKTFAATATGILERMGKVNLNNPIIEFLPDFQLYDSYSAKNINLKDVLSHRTGLPMHHYAVFGTDYSKKEKLALLPYLEPSAELREKMQYNNLHYRLVDHIIEQLSELSYGQFLRENIFQPLEMNRTRMAKLGMMDLKNIAIPYVPVWHQENPDGNPVRYSLDQLISTKDSTETVGVLTSARDMCNWMIANLNGGIFKQKEVIPSRFLKSAHAVQIGYDYADYSEYQGGLGYGLGWAIEQVNGNIAVVHSGGIPYYHSNLILLPTYSLGIFVATNSFSYVPYNIAPRVLIDKVLGNEFYDWSVHWLNELGLSDESENEVSDDVEKEKSVIELSVPPRVLTDYSGTFFSVRGYAEIKIVTDKDSLYFIRNKSKVRMLHNQDDTFKLSEDNNGFGQRILQFYFSEMGLCEKLTIDFENSLPPIEFIKIN